MNNPNFIPSNADLNNYTVPGTYCCISGNHAATFSNCPYKNGNFRLFVIQNTGYASNIQNTGKWLSQIIITTEGKCYIRGYAGNYAGPGTWGSWIALHEDYSNISLSTKGYVAFRNGLIIQWGIIVNGQSFSVILPISFSTADWALSVTGDSRLVVQNGATTTSSFTIAAWVANPASGTITVNTQATSAHITWLAISY